ncbi:hypothetical protein FB565_004021 [Actinoplanes lutulentus]|uniref:Uncharacterized protein n=1 Tax=Actinoplanes lutulentus TaxID=1287878 RepID=A0A327ZJQ4_9ACTN|nr:hypothetical protein [Actinoplanes lutulentus]MBB2944292.1 hypothetical protein [Actinoplanes lutulentus]RAK42475.1 hypothetical protein B0I29_102300 [Actinoplanes lutulentus]
MTPGVTPARPFPASAHRLVLFALDGALLAGPARRRAADAATTIMSRLGLTPGGADHRYAAVVYGEHEVRAIPAGTPLPWDLSLPGPGRPRTDGATAAIADVSAEFLAGAPAGLPGSVDVLALVATGDRIVCPDDLRIRLTAAGDTRDLADHWWIGLAAQRARRRQTELLR